MLTSRSVGARFIGDGVATAAGVTGLEPTDRGTAVGLTTSDFACSGGLTVAAPISNLPGCCRFVDTGAGLEGVGAVFGFAGAGTAEPDGTAAFASAGVGSVDSDEATALPFNEPARDLAGSIAATALAHGAGDVGVRVGFSSCSTVADRGGLVAAAAAAADLVGDSALTFPSSIVSGLAGLSIGCFVFGSATVCARPLISSFGCASALAGVPTLKGVAGIAGIAGVIIRAREAVREADLEGGPLRPSGTALAGAEKPGGMVGVDRRESSRDLRAAKDSP